MTAFLEFLKKRYLLISITLVIGAIAIDLLCLEATPAKHVDYITGVNGKTAEIVSYTYSYKYESLKILTNLMYGLAVSVIVLIALELKYDENERKKQAAQDKTNREKFEAKIQELQEEINTNIFDGVLKKLIPEPLFDLIARDILNKSIIRKNARWIYNLSHGGSNNFIVEQTITYELQNIGKTQITEPLKIQVSDSAISKSNLEYAKISKNGKAIFEADKPEELAQLTKNEKNLNTSIFDIPLEQNEIAEVVISIKHDYNNKVVVDSHNSNYSIVGLELEVNKPADCDFTIVPTFTSSLKETNIKETKIMYEKIPGLLIGQGISFICEEKNEK